MRQLGQAWPGVGVKIAHFDPEISSASLALGDGGTDVKAGPQPFEERSIIFAFGDDIVERGQKLGPVDTNRVGPAVHQARFVDQRLANVEENRADRHRHFLK